MIEDLRMIIPGANEPELLFCLKRATKDVVSYTKQDESYCSVNLSEYIVDLAIIRYNRLNTEGLQSESYSGVSNAFLNDIPEDIKKALRSHRKCYK
ncbi:phage head-tail connector protein [Clostridium algidicarnis]|uniref:phage head-tail connector protein n=1 Tax=Clostridium algidicarnis TaxID=37659 RepID=UPI003FD87E9D